MKGGQPLDAVEGFSGLARVTAFAADLHNPSVSTLKTDFERDRAESIHGSGDSFAATGQCLGVTFDQVARGHFGGRTGECEPGFSTDTSEIAEAEDETIGVLSLLQRHEGQAGGLDGDQAFGRGGQHTGLLSTAAVGDGRAEHFPALGYGVASGERTAG